MRAFIHFFGSPKGGVGKTIVVYSLLKKITEQYGRDAVVGLLDINENDQDAFDIFAANREPDDLPYFSPFSNTLSNDYPVFHLKVVNEIPEFPVWLVKIDNDDTPIGTVINIWEYISAILLWLKHQAMIKSQIQDSTPSIHLVIDTNRNVLNMLPSGQGRRFVNQRNRIASILRETINGIPDNQINNLVATPDFKNLPLDRSEELLRVWKTPLTSLTIASWFFWTIKSVLKVVNNPAAETRYVQFAAQFNSLLQSPPTPGFRFQFIHVLNPSAFMSEGKSGFDLSRFLNPKQSSSPQEIAGLIRMHRSRRGGNCSVGDFIKYLKSAYSHIGLASIPQEFYERLADQIPQGLRPANLLVIPYYYPNLEAFVDEIYFEMSPKINEFREIAIPGINNLIREVSQRASGDYGRNIPSITALTDRFYDGLNL